MIKFKGKTFENYIDLLFYMVAHEQEVKPYYFPHSNHFYVKAHLEEKFQRKFTHKEIKNLILTELH